MTIEQHGIELHRSSYTQIFKNIYSQLSVSLGFVAMDSTTTVFLIHSWESSHV